jgi:2Fe-2S ferredoxin
MITLTLVSTRPDGTASESVISARTGISLMHAAVGAHVTGIAADCGGLLTCATCHVHVRQPWLAQLPPPGDDETGMLAFTASECRPDSRLSCQVMLTPALDGLVVDLPRTQY